MQQVKGGPSHTITLIRLTQLKGKHEKERNRLCFILSMKYQVDESCMSEKNIKQKPEEISQYT